MNISKKIFICTLASIGSVFTLNANEVDHKKLLEEVDHKLTESHRKIDGELSGIIKYLYDAKTPLASKKDPAAKETYDKLNKFHKMYQKLQEDVSNAWSSTF